MTTFNWAIQSLPAYPQADGQTDVVFQVNWQCNLQEDQYQANSFGSVPVTYVAGSAYTSYDQLTQEQVWGWVDPSIDRPEIEANLQVMIDEQKSPAVITPPLPWATALEGN